MVYLNLSQTNFISNIFTLKILKPIVRSENDIRFHNIDCPFFCASRKKCPNFFVETLTNVVIKIVHQLINVESVFSIHAIKRVHAILRIHASQVARGNDWQHVINLRANQNL